MRVLLSYIRAYQEFESLQAPEGPHNVACLANIDSCGMHLVYSFPMVLQGLSTSLLPLAPSHFFTMAPHSSTLAWKIPWMEEPGRLQSMGSWRIRHSLSDFTFTFHFHALEEEMAPHSSVLSWRIPGTGEPGVLPSMGSHRVGHDWSDLAAAAAAAAPWRDDLREPCHCWCCGGNKDVAVLNLAVDP